MNKVYLIDCMEYMKGVPDNHFELAICDPPYGIGDRLVTGGKGHSFDRLINSGADKWDIAPNSDYFNELFRISVNQIIWGGNFFPLPLTKQPLCWNKDRPNQKNLSEWEMAWTSFEGRARIFTFCANGGFVTKRIDTKIHPTQKPVALYKWLLKNYAKPGDKILDTHIGSGSIRIACHDMGFDLTGCELDPDYYAAQEKRFNAHIQQQSLFPIDEIQEGIYQ